MTQDGIVEESSVVTLAELRLQSAFREEVRPAAVRCVVLGEGAHVIVFVQAELRLGDPVQAGEPFAEYSPEITGRRGPWSIHSRTSTCRSSRLVQATVSGVRRMAGCASKVSPPGFFYKKVRKIPVIIELAEPPSVIFRK
jgi:hypothetical protein